ncbi:MAG TPA: hypothetical protein VGF67_21220 [Ktedonobacteraceae bacterium]
MLLHSDQGRSSTSQESQRKLAERQIVVSMSNVGARDDHATMESFFRTLKGECVGRTRFAPRQEARRTICG